MPGLEEEAARACRSLEKVSICQFRGEEPKI